MFKFLLIIFQLLRFCFLLSLKLLQPFIRALKKRYDLEKRYSHIPFDAPIVFHVSSEGELEQCMALVDFYIGKNKKILILFTSESVEAKLCLLSEKQPLITAKCLPLLSIKTLWPLFIANKVEKFFMVRYDFFPELLLLAKITESTLLNATLKSKKSSWMRTAVYHSFKKIMTASEDDAVRFKKILPSENIFSLDLRVLQILKRKRHSKEHLKNTLDNYSQIETHFIHSIQKKIVLASFWKDELPSIKEAIDDSLKKGHIILCAPHDLNNISSVVNTFNEAQIETVVVTGQSSIDKMDYSGKVIIINVRGVLCELFSLCDHAHVGGGFHKSIHSVLEPYVMGVPFISCGPNTYRSTEFDFIKSLDKDRIESSKYFKTFHLSERKSDNDNIFELKFKDCIKFLGESFV